MKKIGFALAALAALLAADILFRGYFQNEIPPPETPLADRSGDGTAAPAPSPAENPKAPEPPPPRSPAGNTPSPETPAGASPAGSPDGKPSPEGCRAHAATALQNGSGAAWPSAAFQGLLSSMDAGRVKWLAEIAEEYATCKALEQRSSAVCDGYAKLFPQRRTLLDCPRLYKFATPMRALWVQKLSRTEFEASILTEPPPLRAWMLEFFSALEGKRPEVCERLCEDRETTALCRMAADPDAPPPDERFNAVHYFLLAARSGRNSYLVRIPDETPRLMARAVLGETGVCESHFRRRMEELCRDLETFPGPVPGP